MLLKHIAVTSQSPNMQSEAPEQSPSALDEDNLSQGNKRRRTSERAARTIPEQPESSNALSTGRRMLTTSSPQRGSSREMTPPEGAGTIKYTRTGRVSKAAKGQRVHQCDECGKVSCSDRCGRYIMLPSTYTSAILLMFPRRCLLSSSQSHTQKL